MYHCDPNGQMTMLDAGPPEKAAEPQKRRPQKQDSELVSIPYFYLDLRSGHVDLFGQRSCTSIADPGVAFQHIGGVPSSKILSVENSLYGHPAPRF